ncbi:MAG: hypothetical protein OXT65_08495 [Alphaproteobacteria bacterium]|nr:hypothetical protein [Alphaproteobacteria bacterium]
MWSEDTDGEIVAQTWAWRGKKGELTFDSLESLEGRVLSAHWQKACITAGEQIKTHAPDVTALHIGKGGKTPDDLSQVFNAANSPAIPCDYNGYRDSENQIVVWRR